MTSLLGYNTPGDGSEAAQDRQVQGLQIVRMVLYPDMDITSAIRAYADAGIDPLLLIARESHGGEMGGLFDEDVAARWVDYYVSKYGHLPRVRWQWGNEPDHVSDSSWTLSPRGFELGLRLMRQRLGPDAYLVGGGLVSGDPHYLDGVDLSTVNAISVHGYGQRPSQDSWNGLPGNFGYLGDLLDRYKEYHPRLAMSEGGVSTNQCSLAMQERYCREWLRFAKSRDDLDFATYFCKLDTMVDGFGLIGPLGTTKPAWFAMRDELRQSVSTEIDWKLRCLSVAAKIRATPVKKLTAQWRKDIVAELLA